METLKGLTLIQWIGIAVGLNSLLMGATPQLTVLFGEHAVPYIIALATLGNGALGVFVTVIGGQGSQVRNVLAMPGVERIAVNAQASAALATMAIDPKQDKIAPTAAAMESVTATAAKAVILLAAIVLTSLLAFGGQASAQVNLLQKNKPAFTGDPVADIKTDLSNAGIKVPVIKPGDPCSFNLFAVLDPKTVVTQIQNCVSDVNKPFMPDVQAALDSATAFKDQLGIQCLTPALAIVKAAVGTPAVTDGSVTTPASMPGVMLIFQKFREFVLSGGPAACKSWGTSTVTGAQAGTL